MKNKYDIQITAKPMYMAEESEPENDHYVFAYTITIANLSAVSVKLIARNWYIQSTETQQVTGLGVVGQQPVIASGQQFEYRSGCIIDTPVGSMHGSYTMLAEDGDEFEAQIPEFILSCPRVLH